jgi:predicted transcriptional regulator of viral defense system
LERVAEVLAELSETIDYSKADAEFWRSFPSPVIQRIGHLWDAVIHDAENGDIIMRKAKEAGITFRKSKLIPGIEGNDSDVFDQRWKIVVNETLDVSV